MTPEELNRTIEFVVESQEAFDRRLAGLTEIQVRLLETQTTRLDAYPKECSEARKRYEVSRAKSRESRKEFCEFPNEFHAFRSEFHEFREEFLDRIRGVRSSLDRFLDKLTDRLN